MSRCGKLPFLFIGLPGPPAPVQVENGGIEVLDARHQLVFALDVVLLGLIIWRFAKHRRAADGEVITAGSLAVLVTSLCNLVVLTIGLLSGLPGTYFAGFLAGMVWIVVTAAVTMALGLILSAVAFTRKEGDKLFWRCFLP